MAWIESHQSLEKSRKLYELMAAMDWDKFQAIGRLKVFWWWCLDHAIDGNLTKFKPVHLALAIELDPRDSERFMSAMLEAGFIEREPQLRLRNWWTYVGKLLKAKYRQTPEKWQSIRDAYTPRETEENTLGNASGKSASSTLSDRVSTTVSTTDPPDMPTTVSTNRTPNLTKPNQTKEKEETPKPPEGEGGTSPPRSSAFHRFKSQAQEVLEYLNAKAGRNFRLIEAHMKPIARRLDEPGITIDGIKELIDSKVKAWKGDSKMDQYLRPETLFKTEKFQTYYDTRTVDQPRGPNGNDNRTGTFSRNVGTYNDKPEKLAQVAEYERRLKEQAKAKAAV